ncbi:sugar transferase [Kineosporia succinea]|uniref:Exopolysaccharide biosynthesis polyprenyl glycosylphosphotransferase n=1 Tax=Kineosporia succinea TaxID=84632 RepID=A0ABT9NYD2_9ACTN|nr:sugar transferase [Kineosporia succinea]MDP9824855.1 exopolysaccharide biosynthesis polyprenyl glycosylphosphotransferase [Kineosporia succinea]
MTGAAEAPDRPPGSPADPPASRVDMPGSSRLDPPGSLKGLPRHADIDARAALTRYRHHVVLADALCAGVAALLAVLLRFDGEAPGFWSWVPIVLPLIWIGIAGMDRVYERRFLGAGTEEFQRVLRSGVVLFAAIAVTSFLSKAYVSRSVVVFAVPVTVLGALAVRKVLRIRLHHARAAGIGLERTIVLGDAEGALELVHLLRHNTHRGMVPVGICLATSPVTPSDMDGVPVMGGPADVLEAVEATQAHVVAVVSHPDLWGHPLRELAWALEDLDVELIVSPGIVEVAGPRLSIRPLAGLSLLHLEQPTADGGDLLLKAAFDRILGSAILLVLAPLLAAIAIAVRVTSPGPALFRQTRVGVGGREFSIYKFRSMVTDAEHRLDDLTTHDEGNGVLFKMRTDPRVTPLGARLRRYSLDELPQLINVARGDMSLVGPRPPLPREVAGYSDDAVRRLRVRPGMTGLWQVSGRSDLSWEQSLLLDLRYVDNWSMTLDLSILWRTVRAVVKGNGAY